MRILRVVVALLFVAPAAALAQGQPVTGSRLLMTVQGITQRATSTMTSRVQGEIYEETRTSEFAQEFGGSSGFGLEGAYRVWRDAFAGVGYTWSTSSGTGSVQQSSPHPLVYGQPRTASTNLADTEKTTQALNLWAGWRFPVGTRAGLMIAAGPSIVTVRQDVAVSASFDEEAEPYTSITANPPTMEKRSATAAGGRIAATFDYLLTRMVRASVTVGFLGASPKIEGPAGSSSVKAGGATIGAGVQFAF